MSEAVENVAEELLSRLAEKPEVLSLAQQAVASSGGAITAIAPVGEGRVTVSLQPAGTSPPGALTSAPASVDSPAIAATEPPGRALEVMAAVENAAAPRAVSPKSPPASAAAPFNPFVESEEDDESFDLIAPILKQREAGSMKPPLDTRLLAAVKQPRKP